MEKEQFIQEKKDNSNINDNNDDDEKNIYQKKIYLK